MISRRALFGLTAGAAASAVAPVLAYRPATAERHAQIIVGMDFGTKPAGVVFDPDLRSEIVFHDRLPHAQEWMRGKTRKWLLENGYGRPF